MVDARLVNYVKNSLSRNVPVEETRKALLSKGWRESDVTEAINLATGKRTAQRTQVSQSQPQKKLPLRIPKQIPRRIQSARMSLPKQFQPVQQKPKKENKSPVSKNLIFIAVGVFVLILIGVIVFLIVRNLGTISEEKLSQGISINLKPDKQVKFNIDGTEHTVTVNSVSEDSVSITVQSNPMTATLNIGETKKFDFEHDGTYDLSVTLNDIVDGKADLSLKKISEACDENWDCTDWSDCEDEEQTRECTDLADCGSERNKPEETQECDVVLNCAQLGGLICGENEICDEDTVNSSTGDCCLGECVEIELVDCGTNLNCLIYNAGTCTLANLTYTSDTENSTWTQDDIYYFEIKGIKEEKCQVYTELMDSFGSFTAEGITVLEGEGKDAEEINQIAVGINNSLSSKIGFDILCNYSTSSLVTILETTDENNYFELSSSDLTANECIGNLFV